MYLIGATQNHNICRSFLQKTLLFRKVFLLIPKKSNFLMMESFTSLSIQPNNVCLNQIYPKNLKNRFFNLAKAPIIDDRKLAPIALIWTNLRRLWSSISGSLHGSPKADFSSSLGIISSADEQISEIDKKVKNLIKNIDKLSNSSCCRLCSAKTFLEVEDSGELVEQKIQVTQKRRLSSKQKELLDRLIQQSAPIRPLLNRKFESLPPVCFYRFFKAGFLKQKHSWTQILPYVAIFGVNSAFSYPFRVGILAGLVNYTFATAAHFFRLKYLPPPPSISSSKCNKNNNNNYSLFTEALLMPWNEEVIFRWILQTLVCDISGSPLAGIVVSAGLFGAAHLKNGHEWVVPQSITAMFSGLLYGTMNYQLGLAASFGAHAMNNFLASK